MTESILKEVFTAALLDLMVQTIDEYLLLNKDVKDKNMLVSKRAELSMIHKVIADRKAANSQRA